MRKRLFINEIIEFSSMDRPLGIYYFNSEFWEKVSRVCEQNLTLLIDSGGDTIQAMEYLVLRETCSFDRRSEKKM